MSLKTDGEGLLQAIIEEPNEDSLRLCYADWLFDHDDPDSAEFIRVQCELAKLPLQEPWETRASLPPRVQEWRDREDHLLNCFGAGWMAEVSRYGTEPLFHRGFLEGLNLTPMDYLAAGANIHRRTPLRQVHLSTEIREATPSEVASLASQPFLERLESLSMNLPPAQAFQMAASSRLANLQFLSLALLSLNQSELQHLCSAPWARLLTELAVSGMINPQLIQRPIAGTLADSLLLTRLHSLQLLYTGETAETMVALAGAHLPALLALTVDFSRIGPQGAIALASASGMPHLESLTLTHTSICNEGLERLAAGVSLAGLRRLYLLNNLIGDAGAIALANSPSAAQLVSLHLDGNQITDRGARALLDSPHLKELRDLGLTRENLSQATIEAIVQRFPRSHVFGS